MMRITSLCWVVIFSVGFASQAFADGYIATEEVEQGIAECSGPNLNTLNCARGIERKKLVEGDGTINRTDGTLRIRIADRTVTLVDKLTESGGDTIVYSYLGFNKKLNSHVLHIQYYEGDAYMVIHHSSGQNVFPSGYPIASPDGKHFLSISEDMFAGYSPNNVEIWQVTAGRYRRVANFEPEWGPYQGSWLDFRRARIAKHCYDSSKGNSTGLKPCGMARIERLDSAWKLIE